MAQLIKLLDYISRYESNPFHYPGQYIRLKQENWIKINQLWENENESELKNVKAFPKEITKGNTFKWNPFKKNEINETDLPFIRTLPKSKKQLTQHFLNQLYPLQLKWATSTITHESFTDKKFQYDDRLKYFLQRFPDIYLVMYYPIFNIKKAPIDGEIILISPVGIEIISLINKDLGASIIAVNDRTWTIEEGRAQNNIISPLISLKRTEQIVKSILKTHNIDFTVHKTVLSQNNHIMYSTAPYQTNIIGKRDYDKWFEAKRNLNSSLKSVQLRAIEALLHHCQTTAVHRPEWKKDEDSNVSKVNEEEM